MVTIDERKAIVQPLSKFWYQNKVAAMDMLRLDLLHPVVSGNKWFKLRLNLKYAEEKGFKTIVTSGGGYSNHLVATAYAANWFGLRSVGLVRGRYETLTPTLEQCQQEGMELIFLSKEDYAGRHEPGWATQFVQHFDEILFVPEGGANERGRAGVGLINRFIRKEYTHVVVAVGSGTTLAGLRNSLPVQTRIKGFVPMKGGAYLESSIAAHLSPEMNQNWELTDQYHFGGFGKWDQSLLDFMNGFYHDNKIPLDIIYTSKMMYGVHDLLMNNFFTVSDRVLCIHSGGLQGNRSVKDGLIF